MSVASSMYKQDKSTPYYKTLCENIVKVDTYEDCFKSGKFGSAFGDLNEEQSQSTAAIKPNEKKRIGVSAFSRSDRTE